MIFLNKNSKGRAQQILIGATMFVLATVVWGDDLTGEDEFLCATATVVVCADNGVCASATPWELNVPQFIAVDLDERTLATTEASGERRETSIETVKQIDGRIYLQGVDRGRAYSFVINEASGFMTVAVARDDLTVTVFGACTPAP